MLARALELQGCCEMGIRFGLARLDRMGQISLRRWRNFVVSLASGKQRITDPLDFRSNQRTTTLMWLAGLDFANREVATLSSYVRLQPEIIGIPSL